MADEIITREELVGAKIDAKDLGECVHGNETGIVTPRLGAPYPTLPAAIDTILTKSSKAYLTYAAMTADAANLTENTKVTVTNDSTASNNGDWQWDGTTFTKSTYDPLQQSKTYTESFATVKSKTLADATDFNTVITEGKYKVVSNASALTMINCPSPRAGVLEVLPISSTLVIQRYTPYGVDKKAFQRASTETGFPATWEEILLKSSADLIYATKTSVSSAIASSLDAITQSDYYGKKYSTAEQNGVAFYGNGRYVGFNSIHTKDIVFNVVNARVFNGTAGNVEYRVYTGAKTATGANGYIVNTQTNIGNPDYSGTCTFPKSDNGSAQNIVLDKNISIPANTPFVIVFKAVDLNLFSIAYNSSATGNLESRSFNLSTVNSDWSTLTTIGSASVGTYVQAGFKLLVSVPQSSSGGQVAYTPTLVMPPKIYALEGLECHIYPEHLLVEDYKLYEHDIACNRGQQRKRGFVWTPASTDAAGNYALTWAVHDKQKGLQIASATTSIVLANKNANNGVNKKVCVIGDSYVNAGHITQGLLDLSATDVMPITLIGTRGTGLNKHEGRGGWTIDNYVTAGQNNYKFTVSGVVTAPAINSTTYSFNGVTYLVQEVSLTGGSGYIICSPWSGSPPSSPSGSGTLTKANGGIGDATIAFSNFEAVPGNPFWNTSTSQVDFPNYLSANSLATPDFVIIQLGVNDTFNFTTDEAVTTFCLTAFPKIDTLIASIKAANANIKIGIAAPPTYADQDAFGTNYACNQNAWRAKRNIITYNSKLYDYFKNKEAQNIYFVPSGVNVDTENNFPTTTREINSHNSTIITVQNNGVHPDVGGYLQIRDSWFAFLKAV